MNDNIENISVNERRKVLHREFEETDNPLPLYRKLIILGTINEHRDPELVGKVKSDTYWLKENFDLMKNKETNEKTKIDK